MSTDAEPEGRTEESAHSDGKASLAIHIQEDGERVGVVNIDEETYEYQGAYEEIEQLLHHMATDGFTRRLPIESPDEWGNEWTTPTKQLKRTGEDLAQYLPKLIEQRGRGDPDVYAEPIGYERQDEQRHSVTG